MERSASRWQMVRTHSLSYASKTRISSITARVSTTYKTARINLNPGSRHILPVACFPGVVMALHFTTLHACYPGLVNEICNLVCCRGTAGQQQRRAADIHAGPAARGRLPQPAGWRAASSIRAAGVLPNNCACLVAFWNWQRRALLLPILQACSHMVRCMQKHGSAAASHPALLLMH